MDADMCPVEATADRTQSPGATTVIVVADRFREANNLAVPTATWTGGGAAAFPQLRTRPVGPFRL